MRSKTKIYLFAVLLGMLTVTCLAEDKRNGFQGNFGKFTTYYYLNPEPERVPAMLKNFLKLKLFVGKQICDEHCRDIVVYFFARTAQLEPKLLESYKSLFEGGAQKQRLFLLKVLQRCGDQEIRKFFISKLREGRFAKEAKQITKALRQGIPVEFHALARPVTKAGDLDFLWTEFMVTGNEEAVVKIIRSLEQDSSFDESLLVAGAAKWSLGANCWEHKKVFEICKENLSKATGVIKNALEEIIEQVDDSAGLQRRIEERRNEKPVTGVKAWALGASALLMERNHSRHDFLSPNPINEKNIQSKRKLLDEWWGIDSREDLFDSLRWIEAGGHRRKFEGWGRYLQTLSDEKYQEVLMKYEGNQEVLQEIRIAKEYYEKLGAKSLLGWDFIRYICLCRWGYLSAHMSEEEAWEKIMPVAKMLQRNFDSWAELGRNYLIGRQFWSYKYTKESGYRFEDAYQRLLDMRTSPWNKYPWNMGLTDTKEVGEPNEVNAVEQSNSK